MEPAAIPDCEAERLRALLELELLDAPADALLDKYAALAATMVAALHHGSAGAEESASGGNAFFVRFPRTWSP
jgi:hypothetical protein